MHTYIDVLRYRHVNISSVPKQVDRLRGGPQSAHELRYRLRYGYVFLVNNRQYTGWAYPSDKIDYSIGEQIAIHYDPSNPTRNFVESFREAGERELFFVPFCLLIAAALPLFIFLRRRGLSRRR